MTSRTHERARTRFVLSAALVALVIGCSSSKEGTGAGPSGDGDGRGDDNGGRTGASNDADFNCCLNDVYYVCPDKTATDKCAFGGFDIGECMAACSTPDCFADCQKKLSAAKPDPSACKKQEGKACPPSKSGALCTNVGGDDCTYDHQCGDGKHCTGGKCYDNESGSKCQYDHQCGDGNHCTDSCCQGNKTNTTCQYDHQCGEGNHCTNKTCYANEAGSPCQYDHQCGSGGNCSSGECQ